MKKLLVIFPGAGYGLDCPLLYYADFLFETNGYERIHLKYQEILSQSELSIESRLQQVRLYIWEQVKNIHFEEYEEIVFLSKSIGGIEAGILAEKLYVPIRQIFLTPTAEALPYVKSDSYVVIGTLDMAYEMYKNYCEEKNTKHLFIEGADHSLEIAKQPYKSMEVLNKVMHFIE